MGILNLRDKTFEEIKEFVSNDSTFTGPNPQNPSKNLDPIYQTRIGAYILERANSLFWLTQFPGNFIPCEISLLEQGQKREKFNLFPIHLELVLIRQNPCGEFIPQF